MLKLYAYKVLILCILPRAPRVHHRGLVAMCMLRTLLPPSVNPRSAPDNYYVYVYLHIIIIRQLVLF